VTQLHVDTIIQNHSNSGHTILFLYHLIAGEKIGLATMEGIS